ncbi:MAG: class I SAM-dependent methyltransferase [Acidimicrobiia bacterium]
MGPRYFDAVHERHLTPIELASLRPHRRALLAHAKGRVLDLGGGCGDHFTSYPPAVEHVTVLGPDPKLRDGLLRQAAAATVAIELLDGVLPLDVADASFDTVVANFLLCTLTPFGAAAEEIGRLVGDEGLLLACEHVPGRGVRAAMANVLRPAWARLTPACDARLDVVEALRRHGLTVIDADRFSMFTAAMPLQSCVALVARKRRDPGSRRPSTAASARVDGEKGDEERMTP